MAAHTLAARSPPELPIEVWQLVMDAVWDATTYSTFYSNQADYRSWALVSRAWRTCAQAVLFRTVELPDPVHLRRFAALLGSTPHLAVYVRVLRAYSRDLHTHDNVLALLPSVLSGDVLPNLRSLLVTRVTEQDTWHPHASRPPSDKELAYMPLLTDSAENGGGSFTRGPEAHFAGGLGAVPVTLHALRKLRLLSCLEVRWRALGAMPECLAWKGEEEGGGRGQGQVQGQDAFLPKLEDLTIAYMDLHGVERLLSALGGRSTALKGLYIDCPHYCPVTFWDPRSYPNSSLRSSGRGLLRKEGVPRKLTLTPSYESDFTRAEFAEVLRALGPVIEDVLGVQSESEGEGEVGEKSVVRVRQGESGVSAEVEVEVEVEVCVVDKADMREWWRGEARASFVRLGARGRLDVTFEKGFWPEAQWLDDSYEQEAEEALLAPQQTSSGERVGVESGQNGAFDEGLTSGGVARRRRRSSRFTGFRPPNKLKRAFHVVRRSLSKLKPARLSWKKRRARATPEAFGLSTARPVLASRRTDHRVSVFHVEPVFAPGAGDARLVARETNTDIGGAVVE
ncbi:hypothetical protein GSI_12430 [Ganoderma sinense ZZ0214-1]|uniref:F-box domain-containing protein n=1 Tax=Ganoderma sinense ZZ0214-1 TaxID=1077348 RepID=A0A2G8RW01_9APHY|nr:hypothetical protein GSI_12430 [Ganoderma sinense ZZ0214-1]